MAAKLKKTVCIYVWFVLQKMLKTGLVVVI